MRLFLPQAATNAAETDYLILALLLISCRDPRARVRPDAALHVQISRQ